MSEAPAPGDRRRAIARWSFCAAVFLALAAQLPLTMAGYRVFTAFEENRRLARAPDWTAFASAPTAFLRELDAYVADRFLIRPVLISANGFLRYMTGVSLHPDVAIGRDGFLFRAESAFDIEDFHGVWRANPQLETIWRRDFQARQDWVEARGARFLAVFAPTPGNLYPEYLPARLAPRGDSKRLAGFVERMGDSGVDILDLTPALRAVRHQSGLLVFKRDTHWNSLAGMYGAQELTRHLATLFPEIRPLDPGEFRIELRNRPPHVEKHPRFGSPEPWVQFDLLVKMAAPFFTDSDIRPVPRAGWRARAHRPDAPGRDMWVYEQDNPRLPTLVMFGDSFMPAIRPYIAEHFRRAVFLNTWESQDWQNHFPIDVIKGENPDLVIYFRAEYGVLSGEPNSPPEVAAARNQNRK